MGKSTIIKAQSFKLYSNNQLSFQYGFSIKAYLEFSLKKHSQTPIFRLCADLGLGSNLLARSIYFSINNELQLYNGGLGSSRRTNQKKPTFALDLIIAFTLTTGLNNYLTNDSLPVIINSNRNVPLYYFSNFSQPSLQNPYNYSISFGTNLVFTTNKYKTSQRLGFINLHLYNLQLSYFNDGGAPVSDMYLGDSKDRFYTGGALISYLGKPFTAIPQIELSFNKFTGYTLNAFEVSNRLDLAYVNYNNKEEKYFNKSLWSLNISNPEKGIGFQFNRYNSTAWDVQHLIHFSIFNSYHLVPYDNYISVSGIYYHNYTNIGLR